MVESSKILTVSYGTFSCTLEGFEDSFSTMKAISEYFRDLAARDRYFGAEPPTPDVEMLARIAEREIERRVDAHADETGIVLKASEGGQAEMPTMPPVAIPPATPAAPPVSEAPIRVAEDIADKPVDAPTTATPIDLGFDDADDDNAEAAPTFEDMAPEKLERASTHPDPTSVAAKLQRIRAVVSGADTTSFLNESTDGDAAPTPFTFDAVAPSEESETTSQPESEAESDEETISKATQETPDDLIEDVAEADHLEEEALDDIAADDELDSVLDMVSPTIFHESEADRVEDAQELEEDADTTESYEDILDDQPTEDALEEALEDGDYEAASFFAEDTEAESDEASDLEQDADQSVRFDDIDSSLIASIAQAAQSDQLEETDEAAAEIDVEDDSSPEEKPSIRARIMRMAKPIADEETTPEDDIKLDDVVAAIEGSAEEVPEDAAEAVGISLAAMDGADELTEFEEIPTSELDPDDEAELLAELAAAEDEFASEAVLETAGEEMIEETDELDDEFTEFGVEETSVQDDFATSDASNEVKPFKLTDIINKPDSTPNRLPENDDEAMSRIMDQADEQMDEPEGSRRRQAIAQLKAAVVATEAARQLGDEGTTDVEEQQEYRKDFDEVVRPRRADRLPRAEVRKERPRPAPLKLVASQRIDEPTEASGEAVAPRRVAASAAEEAMNAESFAAFAEEVGAKELSDLLEAAAAYSADVEGQEDFSRPQIMKKVQLSSSEEFSREDGLRSFGTLLREGRISKVRNGRFQITDQTRFRPEQKAG